MCPKRDSVVRRSTSRMYISFMVRISFAGLQYHKSARVSISWRVETNSSSERDAAKAERPSAVGRCPSRREPIDDDHHEARFVLDMCFL